MKHSKIRLSIALWIVACILILLFFTMKKVQGQDTKIAYLVSYDSIGTLVVKPYYNIDSVKFVINKNFDLFKTNGVYFDVYVEKKRVAKNGKLKRLKYKEVKKWLK